MNDFAVLNLLIIVIPFIIIGVVSFIICTIYANDINRKSKNDREQNKNTESINLRNFDDND